MRDNAPGFSFVEEPNTLEKLIGIADTCYPREGYKMSFFITMKKLSVRHPEILEHASLIYQMSKAVLSAFLNMKEDWDAKEGLPVHNRFHVKSRNGRNLLSGTFRDWYELAEFAYRANGGRPLEPGDMPLPFICGCHIINQDLGRILDPFLGKPVWPGSSQDINRVEMESLTAKERLVCERPTVKLRVALNTAYALLKVREGSVSERIYPDTAIEPLFLADNNKELGYDVYGELCILWNGVTSQDSETYRRICELRKSMDKEQDDTFYILNDEAGVVPCSVATDLFVTMDLRHWQNVLARLTKEGTPYPLREVLCPLKEEMDKRYVSAADKEA